MVESALDHVGSPVRPVFRRGDELVTARDRLQHARIGEAHVDRQQW